jgi:acyl carrier protein phosphodiesterase
MNYLAHAFLAHHDAELLTGGLLGDFVKGRVDNQFTPGVCAGIHLHRAIDRFTDGHPLILESRALVAPERRRFAGILVDIYCDHFLARHWQRYSPQPLTHFTREVYDVLWPQRHAFPERLQRILPWMRAEDWLASYAEIESVDMALHGLARRFRFAERAQPLAEGVADLLAHYGALERNFHVFFPDLQRYTARRAREQPPLATTGPARELHGLSSPPASDGYADSMDSAHDRSPSVRPYCQ